MPQMEDVKQLQKREIVQLLSLLVLLALSLSVSYLFVAVVAAYSALIFLSKKNKTLSLGFILGSICMIAGFYLANMLDVVDVVSVVVAAAAGIATAYAQLKGRLSLNFLLWMCVIITLIALTGDVVAARLSGTTVTELYSSYMSATSSALSSGADLDTQQALSAFVELMQVYWPVTYMVSAALLCALAYFGCKMAQRSLFQTGELISLESVQISKVFACTLLLGAAAQFVGPRLSTYQTLVTTIGANVLFFARIACFLQGAGLATYLLHTKTRSKLLSALMFVALVVLDINLFCITAIGFVDTFANLRRLVAKE